MSWPGTEHANLIHSYLMQGQAYLPECERFKKHLKVKHIMVDCIKFAASETYSGGLYKVCSHLQQVFNDPGPSLSN